MCNNGIGGCIGLGLRVAALLSQSVLVGFWEKQHEHGFEIQILFRNLWTGKAVLRNGF